MVNGRRGNDRRGNSRRRNGRRGMAGGGMIEGGQVGGGNDVPVKNCNGCPDPPIFVSINLCNA